MNLTQFLLILKARRKIILLTWLAVIAVTAIVSFLLPKEYTATTSLVVDFKDINPVTGMMQPSPLLPQIFLSTQADIINSQNVARKVVKNLKLIEENPSLQQQFNESTKGKGTIEDWLADSFLKKLDVTPSRESGTITVSFTGGDPKFAALIANAFAQAYIQTNLELKIEPAKQTAQWFDQQLSQLRSNLESAKEKLSAYQREKGVVLSDERMDIETARLNDISAQMIAAQSAAFDASSRQNQREASAEVANNYTVQNLKVQVAQMEQKIADLEKKVGHNHPDYLSAIAQRNSLKQELDNAISSVARSVSATAGAARHREMDLRGALAAQKARVLDLKKQRDEISVLDSDVQNAQHIYDTALQRTAQTRLEAQTSQTDIAVLNPAVPPLTPSKPKTIFNILLAIFIGGILGSGLAFLMELLDRRVRSVEDITSVLELPVLGITGKQTKSRPRWWLLRPRTA